MTLEPSLCKRLKEEAVRRGKSFQDCLNEYLRLGLEAGRPSVRRASAWRLKALPLGRPLVDVADRGALDQLDRRP